jgi:hypothetical protein
MVLRRFIRIISRSTLPRPPGESEIPDRRRSPRLAFYAHCSVYDHIRFLTRPRCKLVNIGLHGLALESPFLLARGDELTLTFTLGGQKFQDAKAVIVWTRPGASVTTSGLQFWDPALGRQIKRAIVRHIKALRA